MVCQQKKYPNICVYPYKSEKNVAGVELAEGGHAIEFPMAVPDTKLDFGHALIARDAPGSAVVRIR